MEILKPNQLKEKFNDPWIAPYQKVLTMVDGNKVEIVEFHPCISGSHWLLHQYKNNSDLIDSAYRDGNKHVYSCHIGCAPLDLKASFNAAGIDEIIRLKNSYPASIIVRLRKRRNKKTNVVSKVERNGDRRASRNAFELR